MLPETFTFACPVCNSRLTVPVSLAGVIGPCPTCQTTIQAPTLPAGYVTTPAAPPVPPAPAPIHVQAPVSYEIPVTLPVQSAPEEIPAVAAAEHKPAYKPEPRQLPNRREGMEPIGKRMPESMRSTESDSGERRRGSGALRVLVPILFLGMAAGLVFGILTFLKKQEVQPEVKSLIQPVASGGSQRSGEPTPSDLPPAPAEPDESAPVAPPVPEALTPPDPSSSPAGKPVSTISAFQVLDRFLAMKSVEERRPLMETSTSPAELEASCLSRSLPSRVSVTPVMQADNALENSTDYFFQVTFTRPIGTPESYDMLVRRRGSQDPKVVIDPFLDLYGENGRLRKFAAAAVEKPATFQVYISAIAMCNNAKVPNYDKKYTLKLCGEAAGREIATAYFGHASAIGEMLQNDQSGLLWGRAKACTITLAWNTKDDPAHPYIEASSIKALSWNP